MQKVLFLFAFTVLLGSSCTEDPPAPDPEPTLPPITQTGENTFGCYVNGELWLPRGSFPTPELNVGYYSNSVYITAYREGEIPETYIRLDFGKVFHDTVFSIQNYLDTGAYQHFVYNLSNYPSGPIVDYFPIELNSGELNLIKLDTINRIMSGTFYFTAIDTLTGDSVKIEDGRFDLRF